MVTFASGITAPETSVTVPTTSPVFTCPTRRGMAADNSMHNIRVRVESLNLELIFRSTCLTRADTKLTIFYRETPQCTMGKTLLGAAAGNDGLEQLD